MPDTAIEPHGGERIPKEAAHYYDRGGFLEDLVLAKAGVDAGAGHAREKLRLYAATTGGGPDVTQPTAASVGGLVPPAVLTDDIITPDRTPGVFASYLPVRPIPESGLTLYRPRFTTGTSAERQKDEGDAISSTDWQTDFDSLKVVTVAAEVSMTLQLSDRGMIDDRETLGELAASITEQTDDLLLNGEISDTPADNDDITGAYNADWSNSAVNVIAANKPYDKLLPLIAKSRQTVHTARKQAPDIAVMHPRRWEIFVGAVDGNKQPGPWQSGWTPVAGLYPVVTPQAPIDLGAADNHDGILVMRSLDARLYAGALMVIVNVQSDGEKLVVKFDGYRYIAASFEGRKTSGQLLTGAGLTA